MSGAFPLAQKIGPAPPDSKRHRRGWTFVFVAWALILAVLLVFAWFGQHRRDQQYQPLASSVVAPIVGTTVVDSREVAGQACCESHPGGVLVWLAVEGASGKRAMDHVADAMATQGWTPTECASTHWWRCLRSAQGDSMFAVVHPEHHSSTGADVMVDVERSW